MSGLVPGSSIAASVLSTSGDFISSFGPAVAIVIGAGLLMMLIGVVSRLWRG